MGTERRGGKVNNLNLYRVTVRYLYGNGKRDLALHVLALDVPSIHWTAYQPDSTLHHLIRKRALEPITQFEVVNVQCLRARVR
jgi:hypothetical protein